MSAAFPLPAELLPHRAPAILLETILSVDADTLVADARLATESPYAADAWEGAALVEMAAQAAAAHGACGLRARDAATAAPQGFLVGIKNLFLEPSVPLDIPLQVRVRRVGGTGPLSLFWAEVRCDANLLMEGELSVWAAEARR